MRADNGDISFLFLFSNVLGAQFGATHVTTDLIAIKDVGGNIRFPAKFQAELDKFSRNRLERFAQYTHEVGRCYHAQALVGCCCLKWLGCRFVRLHLYLDVWQQEA